MSRAPRPHPPVSADPSRRDDGERLAALAAAAVFVAVAIAQTGDVLTFLQMVSIAGLGAELNPLVARGADALGVLPLVVAKAALVVLVAASFAVVARRHRRLAATVATTGMLAGLLGAYSNVLSLI